MPLIRDTIDPLNEREVSAEEALDLERMGLLLTGTRAKTDDGLRAAAIRQVTERSTPPDDEPTPAPEVTEAADTPTDAGDAPDSTATDTRSTAGAQPAAD